MVTISEEPPTSPHFSYDDAYLDWQIENDPETKARLLAQFMHRFWLNRDSDRFHDFDQQMKYSCLEPEDQAVYVQPDVPRESRSGADMYRVWPQPYVIDADNSYYQLENVMFTELKQCYVYRIPKSRNPVIFSSMSYCSFLTGETTDDLWVAHVGSSEKGAIAETVKFFGEQGIAPDKILAVASLANHDPATGDMSQRTYDYSSASSVEDFTRYGILPDNIRTYKYQYLPGPNKYLDCCGVTATSDGLVSYLYDMDYISLDKQICGPPSAIEFKPFS